MFYGRPHPPSLASHPRTAGCSSPPCLCTVVCCTTEEGDYTLYVAVYMYNVRMLQAEGMIECKGIFQDHKLCIIVVCLQ